MWSSYDALCLHFFTREVFEKHLISWISGGDVYQNLFLRYANEAIKEYQLPEDAVLPDELTYALSHACTALRGVAFLMMWKIESDTQPDVVSDVQALDKARRNSRGAQGVLELTGLALVEMELVLFFS